MVKIENAKKWMVVIPNEQYDWIKETAEKSDVSGAAVVRALVAQAMTENSAEFREGLMSVHLQSELEALEAKKAQIAERQKELRMKLNGRQRVPA